MSQRTRELAAETFISCPQYLALFYMMPGLFLLHAGEMFSSETRSSRVSTTTATEGELIQITDARSQPTAMPYPRLQFPCQVECKILLQY
jgi:hypothetical protein